MPPRKEFQTFLSIPFFSLHNSSAGIRFYIKMLRTYFYIAAACATAQLQFFVFVIYCTSYYFTVI